MRAAAGLVVAAAAIPFLQGDTDHTPKLPAIPVVSGMAPDERMAVIDSHRRAAESGRWIEWAQYARVLFQLREYGRTVDVLTGAARLRGADRFLCFHVAGVAADIEDREQAILLFGRALAERADAGPTHTRMAVALESLGRMDEARTHYRRAYDLGERGDALLGLARISISAGEIQPAIDMLRRALDIEPGRGEVLVALSGAYARLGQADTAAAIARTVSTEHRTTQRKDPVMAAFFGE